MSTASQPASAEALPRFLTVEQVAQELNLSKSHVYRQVEAGEIPHKRIGRAVRIPRSYVLGDE